MMLGLQRLLVLGLSLSLCCTAEATAAGSARASVGSKTSGGVAPNIVLILTDDQSTYDLDSLSHMPKLKTLIADQGATVANSFVTTPVCCPARSALYTGKYIHNIGVFNNSAGSGGCASLQWQLGPERFTMASYLHDLGYATSFAGKYMNNYGYGTNNSLDSLPMCLNATLAYDKARMTTACAQRIEHVPLGWDNWQALRGNSVYYNYTLSNNGVAEKHGDDYGADYLIDLARNRSVDFINKVLGGSGSDNSGSSDRSRGSDWLQDRQQQQHSTTTTTTTATFTQQQQQQQPVFVVAAVPACHEPADPAPQHASYGQGLTAPRTPNFNAVMSDDARHWMIANVNGAQGGEAMNSSVIDFMDLLYRRRLATLQSVDELIESFVETFQALPSRNTNNNNLLTAASTSALDETYIIFTADNGYHLGQFAVALDKRQPYETDLRVPFFVRGPNIPQGVTVGSDGKGALISIDLAPTFLQLAGMDVEEIEALGFDGEPMAALLFNESEAVEAGREFLVEYYGENMDGCSGWLANDFPTATWNHLDDGVNCGLRGGDSYVTEPTSQGMETWSSIQDSTNNTYSCVRSLTTTATNATNAHTATAAATAAATVEGGAPSDEQFCAWDSGESEHFDLLADPWQLNNTAPDLSPEALTQWREKLAGLKKCKGRANCAVA